MCLTQHLEAPMGRLHWDACFRQHPTPSCNNRSLTQPLPPPNTRSSSSPALTSILEGRLGADTDCSRFLEPDSSVSRPSELVMVPAAAVAAGAVLLSWLLLLLLALCCTLLAEAATTMAAICCGTSVAPVFTCGQQQQQGGRER